MVINQVTVSALTGNNIKQRIAANPYSGEDGTRKGFFLNISL